MVKGVPSARSQRYKANQKLQEKTNSILIKEKVCSPPSISGNDVLPSPTPIPEQPVTHLDGAQRAFEMARVLNQTLMHMSPANHISDILKLLSSSISDCFAWYNEVCDRNTVLQQQLDVVNTKLLAQFDVQNAEILNLQDQLKKSQEAQEFYRRQALQADLVPPRRRCRIISSAADDALSPDQLFQQLLWARDDIQLRDSNLARLRLKHTQLENSFEQVLTSSSELLALHVTLLEQHLDLHARQQGCASALSSCSAKLLAADNQFQQTNTQLIETRAQYDTLTVQITQEDPIVRSIVAHGFRMFNYGHGYVYDDSCLHTLSDKLLATRPHLRPTK